MKLFTANQDHLLNKHNDSIALTKDNELYMYNIDKDELRLVHTFDESIRKLSVNEGLDVTLGTFVDFEQYRFQTGIKMKKRVMPDTCNGVDNQYMLERSNRKYTMNKISDAFSIPIKEESHTLELIGSELMREVYVLRDDTMVVISKEDTKAILSFYDFKKNELHNKSIAPIKRAMKYNDSLFISLRNENKIRHYDYNLHLSTVTMPDDFDAFTLIHKGIFYCNDQGSFTYDKKEKIKVLDETFDYALSVPKEVFK